VRYSAKHLMMMLMERASPMEPTSPTTNNVPFKEVLEEALQNPDVRAEWDRTRVAQEVSTWLLRYRIENDLTQAELAQLLGWQQPIVARLESGEREPSLATLHRLVERLGASATISIRPERVDVHLTKPRATVARNIRRQRQRALFEKRSSLRARKGTTRTAVVA
jgi:transcriptional regulator with XRE-family HTH domain